MRAQTNGDPLKIQKQRRNKRASGCMEEDKEKGEEKARTRDENGKEEKADEERG